MASLQSKYSNKVGKSRWYAVICRRNVETNIQERIWVPLAFDKSEAEEKLRAYHEGRLDLLDSEGVKRAPTLLAQPRSPSKSVRKQGYISLDRTIAEFLEWIQTNRDPHTYDNYSLRLKYIQDFLGRDKDLHNLTLDDYEAFKRWLQQKKLSPRTQRDVLSVMSRLYTYLNKVRKIEIYNIVNDVERPKLRKHQQARFLNFEQLDYLFSLIDKHRLEFYRVRDKALITFMYKTGLRRQEVCNLKWTDIDFNLRKVFIKKGKGNMDSKIKLSDGLFELLQNYPHRKYTHVFTGKFGEPLQGNTIQQIFRRYAKPFKKKYPDVRLHAHLMRHTFASHLAMKKVPQSMLQQLMRHTQRSSTDVYVHLMEESYQDMVNLLD